MRNVMKKLATLAIILCMVLTTAVPSLAAETEAVNNTKSGIFQARVYMTLIKDYDGQGANITANTKLPVGTGTAFLINDTTVLTNAHVADQEEVAEWILADNLYGVADDIPDVATFLELYEISVTIAIKNDVEVGTSLINRSSDMDFAILQLDQAITGKESLTLASDEYLDTVQTAESIAALGYPGRVGAFAEETTEYDEDDIYVTTGTITSVTSKNLGNGKYAPVYIHSAQLSGGNSGGPLVTNDGVVIGINTGVITSDGVQDQVAIRISEVTEILSSLGIEYKTDTSTDSTEVSGDVDVVVDEDDVDTNTDADTEDVVVEDTVDGVDKTALADKIESMEEEDLDGYTEDSISDYEDAIEDAKEVLDDDDATQDEVDAALAALKDVELEELADNTLMYVIIGGAVGLVLLIIIIIIVVASSGKKKKAVPVAAQPQPVIGQPMAAPQMQQPQMQQPQMQQPQQGAGETTVLNSGAGDTTVLNAQSFGSITRVKTGERVAINSPRFTIGKERVKVSYCVTDNTAISRTHVAIAAKGGMLYITDMNTTNGTLLNGGRLTPNQEVALPNGAKITMGEEDFVFNAF